MEERDEESGRFVCDFVERLPTTDTGKPFRLYEWQRETLMEFYSTMERDEESGRLLRKYQYLYLEIPKKNGKSELSAALGLYHLFGDGELNAEVYLCAADKDNAGIVFRAAVREYLRGKKCYGGLDLSTTTDLTALALLFPPQAGLESWVVLFWAWRPEDGTLEAEQRDHVPYRDWARAGFLELCPGDMVDFSMVEETVAAVAEEFQLDTLGVDPYLSRTLTPRLMERHIPVIEVPQDMKNLSPAMKEAERLIRAHQMLHEHNTCARWNFGNVRCYADINENIRPHKQRSIGRIDTTVAWIICVAVALVRQGASDINEHILSEDWGI